MLFCLKIRSLVRYAGVAALCAAASSAANLTRHVPQNMKSVVRADSHGRLIRTVVVTPRVLQPKVVPAVEVVSGSEQAISSQQSAVPDLVDAAAKRYDVDPLLVHSLIQVESNYNPYAVSPKGAQGLMQLMPATARRFGVRNTFDVKENIEGGVRYLKYLASLFPQDPRLAIAAYNAGEGAVWKYGNNIPPYRETEQYVYRVGMKYGKARREAASRPVKPPVAPPVETAEAATPSEPKETYAPVQAFVDSEGRLHLRNVSLATSSDQNP